MRLSLIHILTVGFLGELTLGHAGFMSVGAYAGCLFTLNSTLPMAIKFPLGMLVGGLVAALFGVIIGIPALRLKGDYLAIVTLAFGEIIRSVVTNLSFTGGAGGLKKIEKASTFTIVFIVATKLTRKVKTKRCLCVIKIPRLIINVGQK